MSKRKSSRPATCSVSQDKNGRTKLLLNGQNISRYVTRFCIEQRGGDLRPTLTIEIPAHIEFRLPSDLNIEMVP